MTENDFGLLVVSIWGVFSLLVIAYMGIVRQLSRIAEALERRNSRG